jgi:hypothetical protein
MEELWMDIQGYDGDYQISNLGRVKSFKGGHERILTPTFMGQGCEEYLEVTLCKNGRKKHCLVHRLVAQAFVSGYEEGYVVNHIDEDKTNNVWTNLEWISIRENNIHGDRLRKSVQTNISNRNKIIHCLELDMDFYSQREAAAYFGCCAQYIGMCLQGRRKTVKGYHIEYRVA